MVDYDYNQEFDEELTIDLKKILLSLWSRKFLIIINFLIMISLFTALAFVMPKKYLVESDLYVNKANNSKRIYY